MSIAPIENVEWRRLLKRKTWQKYNITNRSVIGVEVIQVILNLKCGIKYAHIAIMKELVMSYKDTFAGELVETVDMKCLSSSLLLFSSYTLLCLHLDASFHPLLNSLPLSLLLFIYIVSPAPLSLTSTPSRLLYLSISSISIRQSPLVLLLPTYTDSALSSFHLLPVLLIFALLFPLSSSIPLLVSFRFCVFFPPFP